MSRRSHISHSCRQNFSTLGRSDHNTDQGDALACATMAFPHHRDSRTSQATLPSGVAFHDERVSTCQLWRPANVPPCLCLRCVPAVLGPHRPGTNLTRLSSPYPLGRLQLALMEWLPMLLALVPPLYTSAGYTFARGTHQPPPFGSARGCTRAGSERLSEPGGLKSGLKKPIQSRSIGGRSRSSSGCNRCLASVLINSHASGRNRRSSGLIHS